MSNLNRKVAETLLGLRTKAAQGMLWTENETKAVTLWLEEEGETCLLAACCVLSSERPKGCRRSLDIIFEAIERKHPSPYVELLIYEALTIVETCHLASRYGALYPFIEQSLMKRAINMDNTIFLLGKLARAGEVRALALVRLLAHDMDPTIQKNASIILRGLNQS